MQEQPSLREEGELSLEILRFLRGPGSSPAVFGRPLFLELIGSTRDENSEEGGAQQFKSHQRTIDTRNFLRFKYSTPFIIQLFDPTLKMS